MGMLGLLLLAASMLGPWPTHGAPPLAYLTPTPTAGGLVKIAYQSREQVSAWVGQGLDVWEVHPDHVVAWVTRAQADQLRTQGLALEAVPQDQIGPQGYAPYPSCYRTYEEMADFLQATAANHPSITTLMDAGDSWEKAQGLVQRDLWAMRITSHMTPGPKPKLFVVAEHHARELVTPEIAMKFIAYLTRNYGADPEVTWLVDYREIWVLPMANPDGHAQAENYQNWRKNTDYVNGCPMGDAPYFYGVDLNRNYGYQWGGEGASPNPCHPMYQGPAPFSEPETQAIRDLVTAQGFDLLISLHSYADMILYPWGYTESPAPHEADLHAMAAKFASYNGYAPIQSARMYITSGDTTDWAYGEQGIPAFTFEIGSSADGYFWPPCHKVEELWLENLGPLLYAAKIAEAPYRQVHGPDALDLALSQGSVITLEAIISDAYTGGQTIAAAQYLIDALGPEGTGQVMDAVDGTFDGPMERVRATLDLAGLKPGRHRVYVMGQDSAGYWGPPSAMFLELTPTPAPTSTPTEEQKLYLPLGLKSIWHLTSR